MNVIVKKNEYKRRGIDTNIKTHLEVCSTICIEALKWCTKVGY